MSDHPATTVWFREMLNHLYMYEFWGLIKLALKEDTKVLERHNPLSLPRWKQKNTLHGRCLGSILVKCPNHLDWLLFDEKW